MPASPDMPNLPGIELPDAAGVFLAAAGPGMGEYSGEILKARQPQLYQAAIELLARGYGIRDTAKILKMSPRSIMAIRDREPESIATIKQRVSKIWLDVAQMAAEVSRDKLLDDPDSISFKDATIGGAVATDKHLVMSGEATQRIEHVVRSGDDDFSRMLEDARRRGQLIEGEIVQDMDMSRQGAGTNGAESGRPGALVDGAGSDAANTTLDMQSSDMCEIASISSVVNADATGCGTAAGAAAAQSAGDPAAGADGGQAGGEGVRRDRGPCES
jgi:hypothetical protein